MFLWAAYSDIHLQKNVLRNAKTQKKFRCLFLLLAKNCLESIYQVNVSSAVRQYSFVLHAQSCLPSAAFHTHVKIECFNWGMILLLVKFNEYRYLYSMEPRSWIVPDWYSSRYHAKTALQRVLPIQYTVQCWTVHRGAQEMFKSCCTPIMTNYTACAFYRVISLPTFKKTFCYCVHI